MNVTKIILDGQVADIPSGGGSGGDSIPSGLICMWSGSTPPDGWALCDGENGTPDLRGRFVLGNSASHAIGSKGGSETVTLTIEQIPSHSHVDSRSASFGSAKFSTTSTSSGNAINWVANSTYEVSKTGGSQAHDNMPPYYTLAYIMKL